MTYYYKLTIDGVVKNEKKVVKLLKKNGGVMGQSAVADELGFDRESFSWRMVRKLEAKGVVWVRTHGKKNLLVLGDAAARDTPSARETEKSLIFSRDCGVGGFVNI